MKRGKQTLNCSWLMVKLLSSCDFYLHVRQKGGKFSSVVGYNKKITNYLSDECRKFLRNFCVLRRESEYLTATFKVYNERLLQSAGRRWLRVVNGEVEAQSRCDGLAGVTHGQIQVPVTEHRPPVLHEATCLPAVFLLSDSVYDWLLNSCIGFFTWNNTFQCLCSASPIVYNFLWETEVTYLQSNDKPSWERICYLYLNSKIDITYYSAFICFSVLLI